MQVYKYELPEPAIHRTFLVALHEQSVILSAHLYQQRPVLWVLEDRNSPHQDVRFWWLKEGEECPETCWYCGTIQFFEGVYHLFSNLHDPHP